MWSQAQVSLLNIKYLLSIAFVAAVYLQGVYSVRQTSRSKLVGLGLDLSNPNHYTSSRLRHYFNHVNTGRAARPAYDKQPKSDTAQKPTENNSKYNYETKWFTQLVDHFSWANQATWQQRYLVNKEHWCGQNCPILFYCGNEGDIEVFTNNTGWMWENAEKLHAMLIFAEHRFYGKSMPYNIDPTKVTPDSTKQGLGYLSSEQALADYAHLLYEIKSIHNSTYSPVIAIGGSYGGMLAAWMRMKYPNIITGALAASAPILQFPGEYDCQQFNRIVTKDFEGYSSNCSRTIAKSWLSIRAMLSNRPVKFIKDATNAQQTNHNSKLTDNNLDTLSAIFKTCRLLDAQGVDALINVLNAIWVNMAMTDYTNEATFLSKMPALPIKHACEHMNVDPIDLSDVDLLINVARASQVYTNHTGELKCLDIDNLLYDPMDVLWSFQACTEMVMPICSDGVNDMFEPQPFNIQAYADQCTEQWGVTMQPNKVQTLYGDKAMPSASQIIFSSGSRDPWSAGCPRDSYPERQIHVLNITGACHHEDLRPAGANDTSQVKEARQKELNIIVDWIQKHLESVKRIYATETLTHEVLELATNKTR